jgi:hypothetical protein
MKETLLTSPLTNDQMVFRQKMDKQVRKAETVALGIWLLEYQVGGVSLERMSREVKAALIKIGVSERTRQQILGEMLDQAISVPQPKRGKGRKGYPISLKKTAAIIVEIVAKTEKLPKTRSETKKKISAFERTSEILAECGFDVKPETVIDWHSDWRSN